MCNVSVCGNTVTALCGATLAKTAAAAANASLTGLEFASGIPGTVGGAVFMNAGAYGGEMKDVIKKVLCYDKDGLREMNAEECDLSYRHSVFSENGGIVLSCMMELSQGDKEEIVHKTLELNRKRAEKQPLNFPSAGSTFKRPEGYFAAALIEESGLKGVSVGGAQVSEKHSGFVINMGGATCEDVLKLMDICKNTVYEKFGVILEPEVKIV
jgi:UDP-N-acetylmuramate dehydrogenase